MSLRNHLALHRFVCFEFGYSDLDGLLERLRPARGELAADVGSDYALALEPLPARARVTAGRLAEYDANITAHSVRLRMTGEHGRTWKPHQYLALLFTEYYLHRYFDEPEELRRDLNLARRQTRETLALPEYTADDLRVLAFQSATGSGKTLLMHAHVLQYRHYLDRAGGRLNNVVLLTPNEQMSGQHERELRASGLHARLFSSEAGADLFQPVEIIDLNKLAEKKGVKRVAVADFGDDNLVLVDEGHLGASGKVWRERRRELSSGGFTFEYSATFNQVVGGKDRDLLNAYGKCLLFDYAYPRFHADGYGKDYTISNLPRGAEDENSDMYLLGCLLTFYQQCRIWRDNAGRWRAFNPAKPLWVFLGKTVSGSSKADRATRSDVARILRFLGWVIGRADEVRPMIARLLEGRSGLLGEAGADYFAGRFDQLPRAGADLYDELCELLFHGQGRLHVVYLTAGEGELHLRVADNSPFGVVNVGDSAALYKLLTEAPHPDFDVDRELGFAARLFADVDRPDSTVNIVVGARRFIAGWNSWRVSTMGLMHVGVGEGPEIIQMFGRGVRLKGWNLSLKRHGESGAVLPADSGGLQELETLYIFGLRANYMQTFRDLLQAEGMRVDRETVTLPVAWNVGRQKTLKLIRLREGLKYEHSDGRPVLPDPGSDDSPPSVEMDLHSQVQAVASGSAKDTEDASRRPVKLEPGHVALFDRTRIRDALAARKWRMGWHNLVIRPETVDRLLESDAWYELHAPAERMLVKRFEDVRALEGIATELIAEYAAGFWRQRRRRWESDRIEVVELDENDPNNIREYRLSVDAAETRLIEDVRQLADHLVDGRRYHLKLTVLNVKTHAYYPLLHADRDCKITIQPVALDGTEKAVVEALNDLAERIDPCLQGRELYLIRNLTRGRGVSFFDDYAYYPDFIVWLLDGADQHVIFLDPKGLVHYGPRERQKVRLHSEIKRIEERVRASDPDLRLHAYVLSVTPPERIGDKLRPRDSWERDGVYFLNDADCLPKLFGDALGG
ncbi:MAG: DEAD/DEAH box helicase [Acidobacteria bacterium]|nr:DEAD/DEAH box helicase [Acidobacteriota bacterium]MYJ02837.1 DEAD/DEAH box helicase [Acidobacteriota bacterium]